MEDARDARRKKILARGTDRLAFITGQAGPDSPYSRQKEAHSQASTAPFSKDDETSSQFSDQNIRNKEASGTAGEIVETERSHGIPKTQARDEILVGKKEDNISASESSDVKVLQSDRNSELLSPAMTVRSSDQVADTVVPATKLKKQLPFSSKQVSLSVSASENMRLLSAVIIGLLVVLSNHGYALGGAFLSGIINFRPLFLVMLTDVTILLGMLMTSQATDEKEKERAKLEQQEDDWASNIGDTLEAWLMFQQVASAIFMDCSICAVIMIVGICI